MNPDELTRCATEIAAQVLRLIAPQLAPASKTITRRLTVDEFAACIERGPEHVRCKIRSRFIPDSDFDGPPYLLHPRALKLFGVTPEIAADRLAQHVLERSQLKSALPLSA
jgi:hypothetical protein